MLTLYTAYLSMPSLRFPHHRAGPASSYAGRGRLRCRLALVLAGPRLGLGQAPQRAIQRPGRDVPEPLGLPEEPEALSRFPLDLIQLPLELVDLPLQGLVLLPRAGDLLLGLVQAGLGFANVLGGVAPVTLGRLGLLPRPLGRLGLAPGPCFLLGLAPVTRARSRLPRGPRRRRRPGRPCGRRRPDGNRIADPHAPPETGVGQRFGQSAGTD